MAHRAGSRCVISHGQELRWTRLSWCLSSEARSSARSGRWRCVIRNYAGQTGATGLRRHRAARRRSGIARSVAEHRGTQFVHAGALHALCAEAGQPAAAPGPRRSHMDEMTVSAIACRLGKLLRICGRLAHRRVFHGEDELRRVSAEVAGAARVTVVRQIRAA